MIIASAESTEEALLLFESLWTHYMYIFLHFRRLSLLRVASEQELAGHGDVCSICYMEMEHPWTVVTECQHFFHRGCLKKWLVVRDNCPLCTKPIVKTDEVDREETVEVEEGVTDFESEDDEDVNASIEPKKTEPHVIEENLLSELRQEIGALELRRRAVRNETDLFEGD